MATDRLPLFRRRLEFRRKGCNGHSPATGPDTSGIRLCLRSGKHNLRFASESNPVAAPLDLIGRCLLFLRRSVSFSILESKDDFHFPKECKKLGETRPVVLGSNARSAGDYN